MKKFTSIIKLLVIMGMVSASLTSCVDFMSTDSNRLTMAGDSLKSPNDTVYSILGILKQVQKISDNYVLLGELRGDLMDVTETSEIELRDLSQFNVESTTSPFTEVRDYYAVINNCNYFIQHADTSVIDRTNKPFVKEVAVAKSIRAWTYLQLVQNYGKAFYYKKAILTVKDSEESFPELGPEQMIDSLIAEMDSTEAMAPTSLPGYGTINDVQSKFLFINTKFLMGDLYLWKASYTKSVLDYEQAARYYANLINENSYVNSPGIGVQWYNDYFLGYSDAWLDYLTVSSGKNELISIAKLANNSYEGTSSKVAQLCSNNKLTASKPMDDLFAAQTYCMYDQVSASAKYNPGDLRAKVALVKNKDEKFNITKFKNSSVNFYRTALLYLRYAEAVNRAGKPNLAFAVLKYGLNATTLRDSKKIPTIESADNKDFVTIFKDARFDLNVGLHNRGCGNSTYNMTYTLPDYTLSTNGKMDTLLFVENSICDELALETGFEGNRFQDLMRISMHRNEPEFLARKVASKHKNDPAIILTLSNRANWYLPIKQQ